MPMPALLSRDAVLKIAGISNATLYRWMANGEFPQPVRISRYKVGWLESDIEAWIKGKVEARHDRP